MDKNRSWSTRENRGAYRLCWALAFAIAFFGMVRYNLQTSGSLYLQSDDGDLYLSIARNLLENGHFIQTARPIEAFVVPPGLPAMTTLLLFFTGGISETLVGMGFADHAIGLATPDMAGMLGFQYAVYGAAAGFMAVTALRLAGKGWKVEKPSKALPWILAIALGVAVPVFYLYCSIKIRHPNPGFILTENYVVFLIALALWMVVRCLMLSKTQKTK